MEMLYRNYRVTNVIGPFRGNIVVSIETTHTTPADQIRTRMESDARRDDNSSDVLDDSQPLASQVTKSSCNVREIRHGSSSEFSGSRPVLDCVG